MMKTKEKILETANKLFLEKGYNDVKIRDICEACDTSIGNFYHHFKSKEAIFSFGYENADDLLEQEFSNQSFEGNMDAILFIIERQIYHLEKLGVFAVTIGCRTQLTDSARYTVKKDRFIYVKLKELILLGLESKEFNGATDVNDVVEWILRTVRGVVYDWCVYGGSYNLSERAVGDVDFLLSGLLLNFQK